MSNFLIEQQRILAQQRQLSEQRESDRANGTELTKGWHPDVIKSAENGAKPGVFDANKERMPLPPRLQKPAIPTVEQLHREIDKVGNAVQDALDQYEQDNASLDAFYAEADATNDLIRSL